MKIVLLKTVKGVGVKGDIKEVSNGHARNFLIPSGKAALLNKHTLNMLQAQNKKAERIKVKEKVDKSKLAAKLNRKRITFTAKADEKGTLYAGLDKKAVAKELKDQGYNIETSEVRLKQNIKRTGKHTVEIALGKDKINIKLDIQAE
jgi:large subunit ribosomal protein L9